MCEFWRVFGVQLEVLYPRLASLILPRLVIQVLVTISTGAVLHTRAQITY